MKTRFLATAFAVYALLAAAGLAAGSSGAWHKDPDLALDVTTIQSIVSQLIAPDTTLGDSDLTVAGVGTDPVGIDDSLTNPPPDPVDDPPPLQPFVVDNTPLDGDCPQAQYVSIQAAINASGPNDTVIVCPGTYPEQVRIDGHVHDGLKLESLKPLQATIQWPPSESPPLALVDFHNADHVTLRGFVVSGPFTFPACSPERHEGILVENAFDEHIHHNHVTLIRNSDPALFGCQEGDAVAIGHRISVPGNLCFGTVPGSARLDHNLIDEYQKNGVQVFNAGTTARVDHNVITGSTAVQANIASNGVVVLCHAAATVDHNSISNHHFTGTFTVASSGGVILDMAPPATSDVDHNQIFDNDYGVETDTQENAEISHNDVYQHTQDGLILCGDPSQDCGPATRLVVRSNNVYNNRGSGITLMGADANLIKSNKVQNNGTELGDTTDGLRVDSGSANNQILNNMMAGNVTHDCHDDSAGSGTAGTANTWQNDQGQTENRPGLCKGATP